MFRALTAGFAVLAFAAIVGCGSESEAPTDPADSSTPPAGGSGPFRAESAPRSSCCSSVGALLPDGKILLFGQTQLYGSSRLFRMNANGTVDPAFSTPSNIETVSLVVPLPSGKILVVASGKLIRLNADGSIDPSFVTPVFTGGLVADLVVDPDGKLLVGGGFRYTIPGVQAGRACVIRLNENGAYDPSFTSFASCFSGYGIERILALSGGRYYLAGNFTYTNGTETRSTVVRVSANGTLDPTYNASYNVFAGNVFGVNDGYVTTAELQPDGKVLMGGTFGRVGGTGSMIGSGDGRPSNGIVRFGLDGRIDESFASPTLGGGEVRTIQLLADNRIMVGRYGGGDRGLTLLSTSGVVDASFRLEYDNYSVSKLLLQSDGKVVAIGNFQSRALGLASTGILRLAPR